MVDFYSIFYSVVYIPENSNVWEDIDGCTKEYKCDLSIYTMTALSANNGIVLNNIIGKPGHRKDIVGG